MKNSLKEIIYQLPIFWQVVLHKTYHLLSLKGDIKFTVNRLIETFVSEEKQKDTEYIDSLKKDICCCFVKYLAKPYEYFCWNLNTKAKRSATKC